MKKLIMVFWVSLLSFGFISGCDNSNSGSVETISGTTATGKGIVGTVIVKDANGVEVNVLSSADGSYSVQVPNMTAPFIIQVTPEAGPPKLYSFATAAGQTVNITPLTNQAMSIASGNGDLSAIFMNWDGTGVTETQVNNAEAVLRANLSSQITAAGLDPRTLDLFNDAFDADGTGIDGVLDNLTFSTDASGVIRFVDDNDSGFSFNSGIDITDFIGSGTGTSTTENGGPLGANEEAATIPSVLQATYDTIFLLASGVDPADSPYANEELVSFTVGADSLAFAGTTLTSPVIRGGNVAEAIWKQGSTGLEYALTNLGNPAFNSDPGFNEINLSMDGTFETFIGQFRDAAKYAKSQMSAGTLAITGTEATSGGTNLGTSDISPLIGRISTQDTTTTYSWTVKSTTDDTVTYTVSVSVKTGTGAFATVDVQKFTQGASFGTTDRWTLQGTVLADLTGVTVDATNSMVTFTDVTLNRGSGTLILNGTLEFFDFN